METEIRPNGLFDEEGNLKEQNSPNGGSSVPSSSKTLTPPQKPSGRRNDGVVSAEEIIRASRKINGYGSEQSSAPAAEAAQAPFTSLSGETADTHAPDHTAEKGISPAEDAAPASDKPEQPEQPGRAQGMQPVNDVRIVELPKKSRQVKNATLIAQQMKTNQKKGDETAMPQNGDAEPEDVTKRAEMLEALRMKSIWEQLSYIQNSIRCPKGRVNDANARREFPYRTLADVQTAIAPLLADTGCVLISDTDCDNTTLWSGKAWDGNDDFRVRCNARVTLTNRKGESVSAAGYALESVRLHDMLPAQVSAATQNYAIKQALIHLFNISDETEHRSVDSVPDLDSGKSMEENPLQASSPEMMELKRQARAYRGTADEFIASITGFTHKENHAVELLKALVDNNDFHTDGK